MPKPITLKLPLQNRHNATPGTPHWIYDAENVCIGFINEPDQAAAMVAAANIQPELVAALEGLDKAVAELFWRSSWTPDDGLSIRNGTPEDGDAPEEFCKAWTQARAVLAQ